MTYSGAVPNRLLFKIQTHFPYRKYCITKEEDYVTHTVKAKSVELYIHCKSKNFGPAIAFSSSIPHYYHDRAKSGGAEGAGRGGVESSDSNRRRETRRKKNCKTCKKITWFKLMSVSGGREALLATSWLCQRTHADDFFFFNFAYKRK